MCYFLFAGSAKIIVQEKKKLNNNHETSQKPMFDTNSLSTSQKVSASGLALFIFCYMRCVLRIPTASTYIHIFETYWNLEHK